jgi:protein-L-isoaspartate(D-aspartate) O-methyltransferase
MSEAMKLEGGERVLEIGAGSGYASAVLAEIASEVYTVDRLGELVEKASRQVAALGYHNVHVLHANGMGWPADDANSPRCFYLSPFS